MEVYYGMQSAASSGTGHVASKTSPSNEYRDGSRKEHLWRCLSESILKEQKGKSKVVRVLEAYHSDNDKFEQFMKDLSNGISRQKRIALDKEEALQNSLNTTLKDRKLTAELAKIEKIYKNKRNKAKLANS